VAPEALAIQRLYMPLFRKHHVRLLLAGHDHLFDHRSNGTDRGEPIASASCRVGRRGFIYTGKPDLEDYLAAGPRRACGSGTSRVEACVDANPNRFSSGRRSSSPWGGGDANAIHSVWQNELA
jgi:3',5'-cyclic AMP phosphodiesterase CpdA